MATQLPYKVKGFICTDNEGSEICVLNSRLTHEANQATFLHELQHAQYSDLHTDCDINFLERNRHNI